MGLSFWHILIVILVIVLLFGAGKIPRLAKDLGAGVNAFKKGLRETDANAGTAAAASSDASQRTVEATATPVAAKDEVAKG
jgi:sec-independent protein translocase protein TatA